MTFFRVLLAALFRPSGLGVVAAESEPIRALIVDGRNNHAWQGTSHAIRQILLQTAGG